MCESILSGGIKSGVMVAEPRGIAALTFGLWIKVGAERGVEGPCLFLQSPAAWPDIIYGSRPCGCTNVTFVKPSLGCLLIR